MRIAHDGIREGLRATLGRLGRDRGGAAAVEFAFVGTAFVGLVLFVLALGFRLYVQVALDHASSRAARLLAVDSTQSRSANAKNFQTVTFCPLLARFLACSNVTISLQAVTDYRNASPMGGSGPPPFSPGQGGSLMLLQAAYALPLMSWPIPGGTGSLGGLAVTVGYPFQNEY